MAVSLAAKAGRLGDAVAVYRLMLQDGVQPKAPTFNACESAPPPHTSPSKPGVTGTGSLLHPCSNIPCNKATDAHMPPTISSLAALPCSDSGVHARRGARPRLPLL